ncbi:MFS transporter [Novosphingobium sp. Chol11]|uniref:MFS transporter n=1 Tax=Novosphingobium sp. Chol11 TaxID=1385763 RepID=UPI0025D6343D|nr:MFS transporter [Novosphingobium sp. Chol11]
MATPTATGEAAPHRASLGFVFAIVLIDMLGFGIVIPVMPHLIMDLSQMPIAAAASYAGWLGAGYAVAQFFGAPIVGNLSDRFGRRPVLLASVGVMGLDYMLQAFAPALWWLAIGRVLAGFTGASFSAAYAYIADVTPPEKRAAGFGLMGIAFGIGFVVGPALGGLLGTFGPRVPFFAAGVLALANFAFGFAFLKESLVPENLRPFHWRRANAFSALQALSKLDGTVLWLVAALSTWQLARIVYPAAWAYFAIAAYGFSVTQVGLTLAAVGVGSTLVQGGLLRVALPRFGERKLVIVGVAAMIMAAVIYTFATSVWEVYLGIAIGSLQGLVQPAMAGLNSRAVDARSQGELQGAVQATGSIAAIVGPPLYTQSLTHFSGAGAVYNLPGMPMLISAAFSLIALALFLRGAARVAPVAVAEGAVPESAAA